LAHGGIPPIDLPRSLDVVLYAQRVKIPVLMVNGDKDVLASVVACQVPLYRNLGTPEEHKDHRLYPGGHGTFALFYDQISADVLAWLDRYLGPVNKKKENTK
jgi:alpha-beta hydrolase superfamily lysophospholipase